MSQLFSSQVVKRLIVASPLVFFLFVCLFRFLISAPFSVSSVDLHVPVPVLPVLLSVSYVCDFPCAHAYLNGNQSKREMHLLSW